MNRRDFVTRVAMSGGSAYAAMRALELIANPLQAQTGPVEIRAPREPKLVIILGAGVAGLTAAYELGRVGYGTILLEARERAGGRVLTLRNGSRVDEISVSAGGGRMTPTETTIAQYTAGEYFNPGPARIPQHHVTLDYCQELGVPLEVFPNLNRQQFYFNEAGAPIGIAGFTAPAGGRLAGRNVRASAVVGDTRGHLAELLAKAVDRGALDQELTSIDKERLIEFLRAYGALSPRQDGFSYRGSSRRGWQNIDLNGDIGEPPGQVGQTGRSGTPYSLADLLALRFANYETFESNSEQQMLMFQPVGGMDGIAQGFVRQPVVGSRISYGTEVQEIRTADNRVRIVTNRGTFEGDYCICTLPMPVLQQLTSQGRTDFSPAVVRAVAAIAPNYIATGKVGLEFNRRFWEEDEKIYGGITNCRFNNSVLGLPFVPQLSTIWYPGSGFGTDRGVLVAYYNFGLDAANFGTLANSDRVRAAVAQGTKIHPQYQQHFVQGTAVYWPAMRYSLGGWSADGINTYPAEVVNALGNRDRNVWFAGEHLSNLTGWMAGAIESAKRVVRDLATVAG